VLDRDWLARELIEPGTRVASQLASGAAYLEWLRDAGNAALGAPMPRVATHNDLTTHNVLLHAGSAPAILDWEAARPDGVPLSDFFYAVADAVGTAEGEDADASFLHCFRTGSAIGEQVRLASERLRRASGLEAALVPICFHACWIHHAANELRKEPEASGRPFLRIVSRLASQPAAVPWAGS
jgi:aminoglycoside phosphotransferase (APT) family kinase protein